MHPADGLSAAGVVIYLFHGVVGSCRYAVRNYTRKHVDQDWFYREMTLLKRRGRPLTMDQIVQHHRDRAPFPPRSFAVTFDDGFENNFTIAAPILQDLAIPAMFYVTTSFIDRQAMSWIDRIEYCLERCSKGLLRLPGRPEMRFHDAPGRIAVLEQLRQTVKADPACDLEALVAAVFEQCGVPPVACSSEPIDRKMSWSQVAGLARTAGFGVGGHSHHHTVLSFLDGPALREEVATSLGLLRRHLHGEVQHYSYPEGQSYSYSDAVIDVLQSHGVRCCPTAIAGVNTPAVSLFELHRTAVDDRRA